MSRRALIAAIAVLALTTATARAQQKLPHENEPLLRLEAGGPTAAVTALAFSPDGKTLYAAGLDKVVRTWGWDADRKEFVPQRTAFRVPIGPGSRGAINALALSDDGKWLAVGGVGVFRGQAGYSRPGLVKSVVVLTPEQKEDEGTIHVFATANPGQARVLRGHTGPVEALAFVRGDAGQPPQLVSAASHRLDGGKFAGAVRLWDVAKGEVIAQLDSLPDPNGWTPGLAPFRTGLQVRVALAWTDGSNAEKGKLRLWEPGKKPALHEAATGNFANSVAYLPDRAELLTGSFRFNDVTGQLQAWDISAAGAPAPAKVRAEFPVAGKLPFAPRALALLSKAGDGKADHAAVALRAGAAGYRLRVVSVAGAAANELPLWSDNRKPILASSLRGEFIAVAGAADDAIRVFAVKDLFVKNPQPQLLRSLGARIGHVAFVSRMQAGKKQIGLVLNEQPPGKADAFPRAGDMLFDFAGRSLSAKLDGWKLDAPALAGWSATLAAKPLQVVVQSPDGKKTTVPLPDKDAGSTLHVLLPPRAPLQIPLLAVASSEDGDPWLALYHGGSGELLCTFAGHHGLVRSLAFSGDGRFLATASDDQTLCLWSLFNLEKFVGKQGELRGVVVQKNKAGKLEITRVDPGMPASGLLKVKEVIAGQVVAGKVRPFDDPLDFYDRPLTQAPGSDFVLRLDDGRDVKVPLSQAAQQRTPLVSLFLTRGAKAEEREWLAWNPIGPYDSSHPRVARAFGWHTNTGKPAAPTTFVPADQLRQEDRREGILRHLIEQASLAPALKAYDAQARPLPPPLMALGVDVLEGGFVRQDNGVLQLRVDGLASDRIESVAWRLDDGGAWQPFAKPAGAEYAQPVTWKRGEHTVRVRVRTREATPQDFFAEVALNYQLPPPTVQPRGMVTKVLDRPEYQLDAEVVPGLPGEAVQVQVYHQQKALDVKPSADPHVKRKLTLVPGANRIEVVAVHRDAAAPAAETGRLVLDIEYTPAKPPDAVPPPLIVVAAVMPLPSGAPLLVDADRPVVVTAPRIRLIGKVAALSELTEITVGTAAPGNFIPGKTRGIAINQEITLKPGSQKIKVKAKAAKGEPAEVVVNIEYRPAPPSADVSADPPGPMLLDDGSGPPTVRVFGKLQLPAEPVPDAVKLTATVLVNGKAYPVTLDGKSWQAKVTLQPGANRIKLRLANDWQAAEYGDVQISYLRPPFNIRADKPLPSKTPMLDFVAKLESALPLTAAGVRATINGRPIKGVNLDAPAKGESTWTVRLKVPLTVGSNQLRIDAGNADGVCAEPGEWAIAYAPPAAPPPPVITLLQPLRTADTGNAGLKTTQSKLTVEFTVQSTVPLKRVTLTVRGVEKITEFALPAGKDGAFKMKGTHELVLPPGITAVTIAAENDGGPQAELPLTLNCIPPVRVEYLALEPEGAASQRVAVKAGADGKPTAPPVSQARVRLIGKVVWDSANPEQLRRKQNIVVYVNGARHALAELEPAAAGAAERTFRADLLLNRAQGNQVDVELPGVALAEHAAPVLAVDCQRPEPQRWLHVQVISPNEPDVNGLTGQVLRVLGGKEKSAAGPVRPFEHPRFTKAFAYDPLVKNLNSAVIRHRLLALAQQIATRRQPNDVVVIYFVGGERDDPARHSAVLTGKTPPSDLVRREDLDRLFGEMPGVKVLLLDVTGQAGPPDLKEVEKLRGELDHWLDARRHGWLRSAWSGPQAFPDDARLLTVLGAAVPNATRLGDVLSLVGERRKQLQASYPTLRINWGLPPALADLAMGAGR